VWVKVEDVKRMTMTNNDTRNTLKTGFINNNNVTGSVELAFDVYTASGGLTNTNGNNYKIIASNGAGNISFVTGMVATAYFNDASQIATVTNSGGFALITFQEPALDGDVVQWKLFQGGVSERQSLSKALKPKADL
jgi:hypothetical protein